MNCRKGFYLIFLLFLINFIHCTKITKNSNNKNINNLKEVNFNQEVCFFPKENFKLKEKYSYQKTKLTVDDINKTKYIKLNQYFSVKSTLLLFILKLEDEAFEYVIQEEPKRKMELKQNLINKINYYSIQLSSIIAQLDCEEERTEQVGNYLNNLNRNEESRFTVYAILAGAGIAVVTGSLYLYNPNLNSVEALVVMGGLLEGYFGYRILNVDHKIYFEHPNNPIRELYSPNNENNVFPDFLWSILNSDLDPILSMEANKNNLIQRWEQFEKKEIDSIKIQEGSETNSWELLLSDGGIYNEKLLKLRAGMLDQIEANISLVQYNIALLYNELLNNI